MCLSIPFEIGFTEADDKKPNELATYNCSKCGFDFRMDQRLSEMMDYNEMTVVAIICATCLEGLTWAGDVYSPDSRAEYH